VHDNTLVEFYRGDIDETSILESYVGTDTDGVIAESKDSYLSVNSLLDDTRDLSWVSEIISYTVKPGDSISSIADTFQVTNNSIIGSNNLAANDLLKPGTIIKIPPVSWLLHKVKSGETLSAIAEKYDISEQKIRTQNGLALNDVVVKWASLIIPGAEKTLDDDDVVAIVIPKKTKDSSKTQKTKAWKEYTFSKYAGTGKWTKTNNNSAVINEGNDEDGTYVLKKKKPQHTFFWGNCTRFVAQYKSVNWWGNAKDWLVNATNAGHATGKTAKAGSIIVFHGKWYNPRYGHVGIVTSVKGDTLIVKDMNFRKLNEVTVRKVDANDRSIRGYIYIN
jgi:surface antigen